MLPRTSPAPAPRHARGSWCRFAFSPGQRQPTRRLRPDQRRPALLRLVAPGPAAQRRRLRDATRRGADPRLLRPDEPLPPQPRRRPPAQLRAAHDRPHPLKHTPPPAPTPPDAPPKARPTRDQPLLRRYLARRLFRLLEATGPQPATASGPPRVRTIGICLTDIETSWRSRCRSRPARPATASPSPPPSNGSTASGKPSTATPSTTNRDAWSATTCWSSTRSATGRSNARRPTSCSRRYERSSIIVTSNRGFEAWGEILGDAMVAAALSDRPIHHAHMVALKGKS